MMLPREIFWSNYRLLRESMRGASDEKWREMKTLAKNGMLGLAISHLTAIGANTHHTCDLES